MKIFLISGILSLLFYASIASAQTHPELFELYENRQIDQLKTRMQQFDNSSGKDDEVLYFRTVLTDNGDSAFSIYERLFNQSNGPLKKLASEKLAEYYYALGFYIKSSEYERFAKTYIPIKTSEVKKTGDNSRNGRAELDTKPIYMIQVGAFSVIENANDLAGFLQDKKFEVSVVDRTIGGNKLFCVWVKGDSSFEKTENIAEAIKDKYQLSYRIVQP
jgi:hypothetical protein